MLNSSYRRFVGGLALALGLVGLASPSANAVTDLGDLFVTPTTGTANDFIILETHALCPDGTQNIKASLNGTGITDTSANNLNGVTLYSATTPNGNGGFSIQAVATLKDIFQGYGITAPSGHYTINLRCQNSTGGTIYGDFLGTINMVPSGTAFEGAYTYVAAAPNGVATTTALAVGTPDPITSGTATSLTATLTPSDAVGSVQFKRGATNIGGPVVVSGGTASVSSAVLPAGTSALAAVFTPTDVNAFLGSTSPVRSYAVAGPVSLTGTRRVASTLTCSSIATSGATKAYVWYRGTTVSSLATSSIKVPASWYGFTVKCQIKTTKNGKTVTLTSPSSSTTIAKGPAPVATTKPAITGILRVAHTLTCSKGTWSPTPSSYKYQWYRSGTLLSGRTYSTYKTTSLDKNRTMTCKVTALKTGYLNGTAVSAGKKIL